MAGERERGLAAGLGHGDGDSDNYFGRRERERERERARVGSEDLGGQAECFVSTSEEFLRTLGATALLSTPSDWLME